jgi:multiple sugar transport system permease protein
MAALNTAQVAPRMARRKARAASTYALLILITLVVSIPLIWLVITSLKVDTEYLSYPITFLPRVAQWRNYLEVFEPRYHFLRHVGPYDQVGATWGR